MMRILHVIPSLRRGGAERLALDIVKALSSVDGIEAKLVYFKNINEYENEYLDVPVQFIDAHVKPSVARTWSLNLKQWHELLEDFRPDIIHSHLFQADLLSRYKIDDRIRYFSHCHDNMPQIRSIKSDFSLSKKRLTDLYERHFIINRYRKSKNTFISISPDTTAFFQKNLPADLSSKIIELPNAINTNKFSKGVTNPVKESETFRILNVGSFVPKKNQNFLVDIALQLKKQNGTFEIRFAGDGPELEQIKARTRELGLTSNVTFLGKVENIEKEMWNSHVYVHTASYEPFGLVLLEAMAAGLPVISLDGMGNRELINDGKNGFLITEQNPSEFAIRILELRSSINKWNAFRESGRSFVRKFDIQTYVRNLLGLYETHL